MEVQYRYDCLNRLERIAYGNGIETSYQYDENGNVSYLETRMGEEKLLSFAYEYDGNGNRVSKAGEQSRIDGGSSHVRTTYQYNVRGQLLEEKRNEDTFCYSYDAAGNRIKKEDSKGETSYHYNEKNQLISEEGIRGQKFFTYNRQGSIIREDGPIETRSFTYNTRNQQVKVECEDGWTQVNRYDPEGLRYEMKENEKLFRFIYHRGELLYEDGKVEATSYQLGYGTEAIWRSQKIYYYHKDEQLSTALIMDDTGQIQNQYQYDAFGKDIGGSEKISNRIRYTGQQYDGLTQQLYLRARYYNPQLGRFMQEDPYHGDGLNLYAYCRNNPVMYYDPSGYAGNPANPTCPPNANINGDGGGYEVQNADDGIGQVRPDFYVTPEGDVMPATGYRYMDSKYAEQTMESMSAPGSYFGFEKYDSASVAQDKFQIAPHWSDSKMRGEFDTLQVIDDAYVPTTMGNTTNIPEPITVSYPEYGSGGIPQLKVDKVITFTEVVIIGD